MKLRVVIFAIFLPLLLFSMFFLFNTSPKDDFFTKEHTRYPAIGIENYRTDFFDFGEFHCTKNKIYISDLAGKNKKTIYSDKDFKDDIGSIILSPDQKKAIVHFTDPLCGAKDPSLSYNQLLLFDTGIGNKLPTGKNEWIEYEWAPNSKRLAYLYNGSLHIISIDPIKGEEVINNLYDPSVEDIYLSREVLWVNDSELYVKTNHTTVEKINLQDKTVTQVMDVNKYNLQINGLTSLGADPMQRFISLYSPGTQPQDKVRYFDLSKKDVVEIMPLQITSLQNHDCLRSTKWSTNGKYLYLLISNGGCFGYDEFYTEKNHIYRFTRDTGKTEKLFSFAVSANPESVHHSHLLYATDNEVIIDSPIHFKHQTEESERRVWKYQVENKKLNQLQVNPNFIDEIQNLNQISASIFQE